MERKRKITIVAAVMAAMVALVCIGGIHTKSGHGTLTPSNRVAVIRVSGAIVGGDDKYRRRYHKCRYDRCCSEHTLLCDVKPEEGRASRNHRKNRSQSVRSLPVKAEKCGTEKDGFKSSESEEIYPDQK